MKRKLLLASLAAVSALSIGQTKLDLQLSSLAKEAKTAAARGCSSRQTANRVTVIGELAKGAAVPEQALEEMGIKVTFNAYGMVVMNVPADRIVELEALEEFTSLEANKTYDYTNYTSKEVEHVLELHDAEQAMAEGLPQAYNGEGVVLGIADSGFDLNHVNFRDPVTHKTRFGKVLLYKGRADGNDVKDEAGNAVTGIEAFDVYTGDEIEQLTTDCTSNMHGSHTLGTAAGSYDGDYLDMNGQVAYTNLKGAAYKADLIAAAMGNKKMDEAITMATTSAMGNYADSVGKPLVLSYSFGGTGNWLDGKLAINKFFDEFTDHGNKPGRIVCMGACNTGSDSCSIYKELNQANGYSLVAGVGYSADSAYVQIFNSNDADLDISYQIYSKASASQEPLKSYTMNELLDLGVLTYQKNSDHDNRTNAKLNMCYDGINTEGMSQEELTSLFILFKVTSKDSVVCKPRLFVSADKGSAKFIAFNSPYITDGDATSTFNFLACTNSVLSVGAWTANVAFKIYLSVVNELSVELLWNGNPLNDIAAYSSYVVADDNGVSHPDFCAPGTGVISGTNSYCSDRFDENGVPKEQISIAGTMIPNIIVSGKAREEYGRQDGHSSYISVNSGTSMACPNAAGIIALWLQANPMLTTNEVREVIRATADQDEFTAASPARFGAGKINALAGLKYIMQNHPTAIHEVFNAEKMGLDVPSDKKMMEDGQIVIVRRGNRYNAYGQRM